LGADLWFVTGEGPRLSTVQTQLDFENLRKPEEINETLNPVYETVKILSKELPKETTLIGFAGAPWTVATYMVAGRGTPDQAPAHLLKNENPELFDNLINLLVEGTIEYLSHQINAGAEVIKIFDSWAGSLKGNDFDKYALEPCKKIISVLKSKYPQTPIIAFPRQAGDRYIDFAKQTGADCLALDDSVSADWIARNVQADGCVQGNLASSHMVSGGKELIKETKKIVKALSNGPHIFNLGHGITPDADPNNVQIMIDAIRETN
jgi:uroporphyrinogen decarboxylase